jgi:Glycosyl hydrolases family 38 N-terminal domain/Alpha mannosidase middle domain
VPRVHVVPHTHWDREWYLTFEQFRDKLIVTMDTVLELLRSDPGWTHFHLDGQTAMIDDYLSIRPQAEQEIRELVANGRLSCGPWVTLVDEFLVSGESIVRNLEDGMRRAGELGGCTMLGYLPDQFGHVGQMPQILRSAGIERSVTWRGVPAAVRTTTFTWKAPDGSTIDVCYLPFGYGQGARAPGDPTRFRERIVSELDRLEPFAADGEARLLTVGDDHEVPLVNLPDLVRAANEGGLDVRIGSLISFVEAAQTGPVTVHGELRSSARANLLPNTYSARIPQKMERGLAETLLERYAEPLAALVPGAPWPAEELSEAWMQLHLNGAHDSVCGCSTDAVAEAVNARTRRATEIARTVTDVAFTRLCGALAEPGAVRFNPSPFERDGVPPLGWSLDVVAPPAQETLTWAVADDALLIEGAGVRLRFEDEPDVGDLYNFCPGGDKRAPVALVTDARRAEVSFDGVSLALEMSSPADDDWVALDIEVDNERVDHRVRMLVELPEPATTTRAGSAFEIVERQRLGEGGTEEPASPNWPARAFVVAGGTGYLTEGVIEYELTEDGHLAVTLLRCTGTISRPHAIATRTGPAGPDVATPEAQMVGKTKLRLGILRRDPGRGIIHAWERFALPLIEGRAPGGRDLPSKGSLLDLDVPALSSIRKVDGHTEVRIWNPWADEQEARIGATKVTLLPHRISTVRIS